MRKTLTQALLAATLMVSALGGTARAEDPNSLTEDEVKEAVQFIYGNAIFVLLHEVGHMFISELQLPVLGREEDAVDALSTILLLEARDETLDTAITDSADGWFLSDQEREKAGGEQAFWDAHALDKQRAYQMVCLMVGQDADGFKEFADSLDFPQERREECKYEYEKTLSSWSGLLTPHAMPDGGKNTIKVTYEEPAEELQPYAQMMKDAKLLETISESFAGLYKLNDGIQFVATTCGQPNAFWVPSERKLVYCYELASYHDQLISKWLVENRENGDDQQSSSDQQGSEDEQSTDDQQKGASVSSQ
ncbi:DUF4344 domain-containing metallopeptidase [Gellertiella hungarica]|uniref:Metallopeptidase n=1 Tax=Gellertiella hungarica TaxID=1572859 RepID=A0A7W6NL69_9HYPH|nr:DUF4344 domain-containing metallopeptidase [Gellertiella hungarica]MBB4065017.1 hypothetical protein [Gellertiella hungarica]